MRRQMLMDGFRSESALGRNEIYKSEGIQLFKIFWQQQSSLFRAQYQQNNKLSQSPSYSSSLNFKMHPNFILLVLPIMAAALPTAVDPNIAVSIMAKREEDADAGMSFYKEKRAEDADAGMSFYKEKRGEDADAGMSFYKEKRNEDADAGMSFYKEKRAEDADAGMSFYKA
ncbi:hypothetical protein BDZ45DRAFT_797397 [Acephala macrosclerotiorum]|nr:hypothetical protein BDZ45DRAFT_797397 [Acephala macrosclerotiorum]